MFSNLTTTLFSPFKNLKKRYNLFCCVCCGLFCCHFLLGENTWFGVFLFCDGVYLLAFLFFGCCFGRFLFLFSCVLRFAVFLACVCSLFLMIAFN